MLAGLLEFVFIWILQPLIAMIFIIPAFYFNDTKCYGKSTFFMAISICLLGFYFWSDIELLVSDRGMPFSILLLSGAYIIAGVITSFIYWIFYNWKAKERFEKKLEERSLPSWATNVPPSVAMSLRKYLVLNDSYALRHIFDDPTSTLNLNVKNLEPFYDRNDINSYDEGTALKVPVEDLDAEVNKILPPRFKTCKYFIVGAGCSWPVTLIWLLLSRVIKQMIERLTSLFSGMFDKISKLAFGKF